MKKLVLTVVCLALGSLAFSQQTPTKEKQKNFEIKKQERLDMLKSELNLTDAQVSEIKELHEKKRIARMEKAKIQRQEMKFKMKENDEEMKQILTAEQYTKWQEKRAQKRVEAKAKQSDLSGNVRY